MSKFRLGERVKRKCDGGEFIIENVKRWCDGGGVAFFYTLRTHPGKRLVYYGEWVLAKV